MENHSGFEIPIHQSITTALLVLGVPRNVFILNATMGMAFVLGMSALYMIPVFVLIHFLGVLATKKDEQFFEIFKRHRNLKTYYSA
jgi:type IV secretory pathway TrbD component